jgi:hypothetical protein
MNMIHGQRTVAGLVSLLGFPAHLCHILIVTEGSLIAGMGIQKQKDVIHGEAGLVNDR